MLDKIKEFKPTSWSINNKTTIFILTVFLALAGYKYYNKLPKEAFPEVKVPTIYILTFTMALLQLTWKILLQNHLKNK